MVRLRDVAVDDVDAYVRMRCDPAMMGELGGPLPREGMADKVRRDAEDAAADRARVKMIVPEPDRPDVVAGSVTIWSHEAADGFLSEIGWMVLPEFQGRGLGKGAVREQRALERAVRLPGPTEQSLDDHSERCVRKDAQAVGETVTCSASGVLESRMWRAEVTATSTHSPPLESL